MEKLELKLLRFKEYFRLSEHSHILFKTHMVRESDKYITVYNPFGQALHLAPDTLVLLEIKEKP